jgi:hypothetical protein
VFKIIPLTKSRERLKISVKIAAYEKIMTESGKPYIITMPNTPYATSWLTEENA